MAPRTDCSASRSWGGARGGSAMAIGRANVSAGAAAADEGSRYLRCFVTKLLLTLDDHRFHVGRGALGELDLDQVGADVTDRLLELDLALVDLQAARVADRIGNLGGRDRPVEAAIGAGLGGD